MAQKKIFKFNLFQLTQFISVVTDTHTHIHTHNSGKDSERED